MHNHIRAQRDTGQLCTAEAQPSGKSAAGGGSWRTGKGEGGTLPRPSIHRAGMLRYSWRANQRRPWALGPPRSAAAPSLGRDSAAPREPWHSAGSTEATLANDRTASRVFTSSGGLCITTPRNTPRKSHVRRRDWLR